MTSFLIKNCDSLYLGKNLEWISIDENDQLLPLFHTPHKDVALNQLVELCSKDIHLRAEVITCELDHKNRPIILQQETAA